MNDTPRSALVTGGAQGIGKGIAQRLLKDAWQVAIIDADDEAGRETVRELSAFGSISFLPADTRDEPAVAAAVAAAVARFGRLDALVNNAGIGGPFGKRLEELTLDEWNAVIGVNLTGYFLCAKHAATHLRKTHGAIVNIASTRALQSEANTEPYSASKGGVVALTHALAISLGPDIRVNCISPGWIDTSEWKKSSKRAKPRLSPQDHAQHPCGRVGTPDDIAAAVAFFLSAEAGFVTGQNLYVDGGMTKKMIYV